jgi:hypothetical protein
MVIPEPENFFVGVLHPTHVSVEQEIILYMCACAHACTHVDGCNLYHGKVGSCNVDPGESDLSLCWKWGYILNYLINI